MNIRTTRIMLITATTLFTGCASEIASEVVKAVMPSGGENNTTQELKATQGLDAKGIIKTTVKNTTDETKATIEEGITSTLQEANATISTTISDTINNFFNKL